MDTKSIYANLIEQFKILNNSINKQNEILITQNEILGSFLIQATSQSKFVKMTPTEIEKDVPKYVDLLDKIRNSTGITNEKNYFNN